MILIKIKKKMCCECCGLRAMKTWNSMKVAWLECLTGICAKYEYSQMPKRTIILLVVGLDGAGKSTVVNYLFNKSYLPKSTVTPTIGFRTVSFKYKKRLTIRLYDVGGSPQIRALWPKYYEEVHGVIYVVDASDGVRLGETAKIFQELACHDFISEKPILILGNKQDKPITLSELNIEEFMNVNRVVNFARCFTRIEVCTCFKDDHKAFNLNKSIDMGFEWLVKMIDYNYETYEKEMKEKKEKVKARRKNSSRSWTAPKVPNPFDYPDTDSETYGKPIVPNDELIDRQRKARRKRKSLMNLFKKSRNKTAPLTEQNNVPTRKEMKELIRSITIEDLIRNTHIDENAVVEYRKPKRRRKKRPATAPANIEPTQIQVHRSQEGNTEETIVQINHESNRKKTIAQVNDHQVNGEETKVQVDQEDNISEMRNDGSTETIEEII